MLKCFAKLGVFGTCLNFRILKKLDSKIRQVSSILSYVLHQHGRAISETLHWVYKPCIVLKVSSLFCLKLFYVIFVTFRRICIVFLVQCQVSKIFVCRKQSFWRAMLQQTYDAAWLRSAYLSANAHCTCMSVNNVIELRVDLFTL